jgi:hypothetical protein
VASLYREGITIARVDAEGRAQIEQEFKERVAEFATAEQGQLVHQPPKLAEGELVALDKFANVHKLNPYKLDLHRVEQALGQNLPNMGAARDFIKGDRAEERAASNAAWQDKIDARGEAKREREETAQAAWSMDRDAELARVTDSGKPKEKDSGLKVVNGLTGAAEGLTSFVCNFLDGGSGKPPPSPKALDTFEQIKVQRKALAALENIRESMEKGEGLSASDVQHLTPSHLENIKLRGDEALRQIIDSMERGRQLGQDYGRARER